MNLNVFIERYINLGYKRIEAYSKVCQDIILNKISKSNFKNNITVKGGVVIHNLSKDIRRATRDLDLDFIKYSLSDKSIINFINNLNNVDDGIGIKIINKIERLHHQDYDGKRVNLLLFDNFGTNIETKLDIGVNTYYQIKQDEFYFDLSIIDDGVSILVNSKEQIFAEKLKSMLKFGIRSTRYKDIFDLYYLITETNIDKNKLLMCFNIIIFKDNYMKEKNIRDVIRRINNIINNKGFIKMIDSADNNWLNISVDEVINTFFSYIKSLELIKV